MQKIKNDIQQKIDEMIISGELSMTPKWHFMIRGVLYALGFILIFLISVLFISILLFKSRTLPPHTAYELLSSIETLPYIILSLAMLLLVSIYMIKSDYSFIYKRPAAISLGLILIFILSLAYIADIMTLHDKVERRMHFRPMPYIGEIYKVNGKFRDRL